MMILGRKTRWVFERYNIVNDSDLRLAAQKQEEYLKSQMGTVLGTMPESKHSPKVNNLLISHHARP